MDPRADRKEAAVNLEPLKGRPWASMKVICVFQLVGEAQGINSAHELMATPDWAESFKLIAQSSDKPVHELPSRAVFAPGSCQER